MRRVIYLILFLSFLSGCTYEGFTPEEWIGGKDRLLLELSESTISFIDHKEVRDTVVIRTNGEGWNFNLNSAIQWCKLAKRDSLLILSLDSSIKRIPRLAIITITANYNDISISKELLVVQPAKIYSDSDSDFKADNLDCQVDLEMSWSPYANYLSWNIDEGLKKDIYVKLGITDLNLDFADAVREREIMIKGYDADGVLSRNVINDNTANFGFWFDADGKVTTSDKGLLCWAFEYCHGYVDYSSTVIYAGTNVPNADATYVAYYVLVNRSGEHYVIKLNLTIHESLPVMIDMEGQYEVEHEVICRENSKYINIPLKNYIPEIETLLQGAPDLIYISDGVGGYDTDWHIGHGIKLWLTNKGNFREPFYDGTLMSIVGVDESDLKIEFARNQNSDIVNYREVFNVQCCLVNSQTMKGVEVFLNLGLRNLTKSDTYKIVYDIPFYPDYENVEELVADEFWSYIIDNLGGKADRVYIGLSAEYPCQFQLRDINDGWFGKDGVANWGSGKARFQLKSDENGYIIQAYCHGDNWKYLPAQANAIFRFENTELDLMTDVYVTVNIE